MKARVEIGEARYAAVMVDAPRRSWPDRRPPVPGPGAPWATCASCGQAISPDERDDATPPRHIVCDVTQRRALTRRIEATRAVHRAIAALASVPPVRARLSSAIAALPDACDVSDALAFVASARTILECTPDLSTQQRRVATSFLDATSRKLAE